MDLRTIELKIARSENLPALPQIVSSVLKIADDPNCSARQVEQIIERDAAMTAKILRVANSSFYATAPVPNIGRAISLIGLNALRSLVVSVAYQQVIGGKASSQRFCKKQFWQHSLATATTARILGKLRMPSRSEELYGAAMMHDIGLIVLDKFAPTVLDDALAYASREVVPLHAALRNTAGFDQTEVGAALAERWKLSPPMQAAIKHSLNPMDAGEYTAFTNIVAAANQLSNEAGYLNNSPVADYGASALLMEQIGIPPEQSEAIVSVIKNEVSKAETAFAIR